MLHTLGDHMQFRNTTLVWSAAGLLAAGTVAGLSAPTILHAGAAASTSAAAPVPMITAPNYRAIVARNQAAVVGITTAGPMNTSAPQGFSFGGDDEGGDNPLAPFFRGHPIPRQHGMQHAQGSGFLISADGLVLTNAHVVDGAKEVTVKLSDHREYKAKALGADKSGD